MYYFIIPLILVMYFEMLGKWLLVTLDMQKSFAYLFGFISFFGCLYVLTSILTIINVSFKLLLMIVIVLILISLFIFIKDYKKISFKMNALNLGLLLIMVGYLTYFSYLTTLGDLNGFDAQFYLNLVSDNVGINTLNSIHPYFGIGNSMSLHLYNGQSFYYVASILVFMCQKIFELLHLGIFMPSTSYIWMFQILMNFIIGGTTLLFANEFIKNKKDILKYGFVVAMCILFIGKLYYNNVFGFIGNNYRLFICAMASYALFNYFKEKNKKYLYFFYLSLLANCAVSSSSLFILILSLFLYFVVEENNEYIFKEVSFVLFFPLINVLNIEIKNIVLSLGISLLVSGAMHILNDILIKIFNRRNKMILIAYISLTMFILSMLVTHKFFNLTALTDTLSQQADMTINYLRFDHSYVYNYVNVIILGLIILNLIFNTKDLFTMMNIVLIVMILNPFCCGYINKMIPVYYRMIDIIINPFLLFYYAYMLDEVCPKEIGIKVGCILCVLELLVFNVLMPNYYHSSFVAHSSYDYVHKMNKDDVNVIQVLKDRCYKANISSPYIITLNYMMHSNIKGQYLFGRNNVRNYNWTESESQLYLMFYPNDEYGNNYMNEYGDYEHMPDYIKDANIDFIVLDKSQVFHDVNNDTYYSLKYPIESSGVKPFYENDTYYIYYFGDKELY